jgi:hypothetical protein
MLSVHPHPKEMDAGDAHTAGRFSLPHAGDEDNERRADLRRGSGARGRGEKLGGRRFSPLSLDGTGKRLTDSRQTEM